MTFSIVIMVGRGYFLPTHVHEASKMFCHFLQTALRCNLYKIEYSDLCQRETAPEKVFVENAQQICVVPIELSDGFYFLFSVHFFCLKSN